MFAKDGCSVTASDSRCDAFERTFVGVGNRMLLCWSYRGANLFTAAKPVAKCEVWGRHGGKSRSFN